MSSTNQPERPCLVDAVADAIKKWALDLNPSAHKAMHETVGVGDYARLVSLIVDAIEASAEARDAEIAADVVAALRAADDPRIDLFLLGAFRPKAQEPASKEIADGVVAAMSDALLQPILDAQTARSAPSDGQPLPEGARWDVDRVIWEGKFGTREFSITPSGHVRVSTDGRGQHYSPEFARCLAAVLAKAESGDV